MEFSSFLLLLLVALSVSAVQEGSKTTTKPTAAAEAATTTTTSTTNRTDTEATETATTATTSTPKSTDGCPSEGKSPSMEFPVGRCGEDGCPSEGKSPSMEFPVGRCGEERHSLYHNYTNHSNSNWIMKATVQFDGVLVYCFIQKRTGLRTYCPWGIGKMDVDYRFRKYYKELSHRVKGLLSKETDSDFTLRYGCEAERSSSGAVTLLTTTAEYRLNGKLVLRFNADRDQWEELDGRFLAVKTEMDSLTCFNQIIKHYLLQGCTDRLQSYLEYYEENIRNRTATLSQSDGQLPYPEDCNEGSTNSTHKMENVGAGISSVLSCIGIAGVAVAFALLMKKVGRKKCENVVRVIKHAYRRHSDGETCSYVLRHWPCKRIAQST
ncbi:hypothetical protein MHYP_G00169960 [Metynnis hypsauchen]